GCDAPAADPCKTGPEPTQNSGEFEPLPTQNLGPKSPTSEESHKDQREAPADARAHTAPEGDDFLGRKEASRIEEAGDPEPEILAEIVAAGPRPAEIPEEIAVWRSGRCHRLPFDWRASHAGRLYCLAAGHDPDTVERKFIRHFGRIRPNARFADWDARFEA